VALLIFCRKDLSNISFSFNKKGINKDKDDKEKL
jgi:hypothetical protein